MAAAPQPEAIRQTPPASSVTVDLPRLSSDEPHGAATASTDASVVPPATDSAAVVAPDRKVAILPWLAVAVALGAAGAFLFWRSRSRHAIAAGPAVDALVAPQPAPKPVSPPTARRPLSTAPPTTPGIVSTRIRPWIEIGFQPIRCLVEDDKVVVDFELELFNSGSAPARAVLAEASLFNAGQRQDEEIGAFFAQPVGQGERIAVIQPLRRIALRTQVLAPLAQVQEYEVAGQKLFVPIIAFNAIYKWGNNDGQSSVAYLLGRDTKAEKMAPLRLDLGARAFMAIGARLIPLGVRS